jgi:ABC-type lipoprotein export system ATPase subunit
VLKRIVIENYRSCLRTSIDLHPNLSVLIGPNGSGKTNILQSIMLLSQVARQPEHARGMRGITTKSRMKAMFEWAHSSTELNASMDAYTNEFNHDILVDSRQKWLFKKKNEREFISGLPLAIYHQFHPHLSQTNILTDELIRFRHFWSVKHRATEVMPKWAQRDLGRVARYWSGIRYYGASQFTNPGSCPTSFEIEREGNLRGPHRMSGHAKFLYGMYSAKRANSNRNYDDFMEIVGPKGLSLIDDLTFREVKSSSTEYSVRVGGKVERRRRENLLVIPQFKIGRQTLSPNQLSEGTFKTLALLFHIITEDSTALLIEEPEVCVHQGLLSSILELVKSYSNHKQMIMSTHSDYVLDHVRPDNVYRVGLQKAHGTIARPIRKTMTSKEFAALRDYLERDGNLGEYWREGGLGDRP